MISSHVSALLRWRESDILYMRLCEVGPQLTNALLFQTVSLCVILHSFECYVFKFSNFSFLQLEICC